MVWGMVGGWALPHPANVPWQSLGWVSGREWVLCEYNPGLGNDSRFSVLSFFKSELISDAHR